MVGEDVAEAAGGGWRRRGRKGQASPQKREVEWKLI